MHISEAEIKAVSESCTVSRFYSNPILLFEKNETI